MAHINAKTGSMAPKLLSVKFDFQTYAEFSAATTILRERSMSSLVHRLVQKVIADAKGAVSEEEFARVVDSHKLDIARRSGMKQAERKRRTP